MPRVPDPPTPTPEVTSQERSLGRGAAAITFATIVSRVTGLLRVVAVAAAMGATYLANTYNSANTAPNLIFELVAAGVLTSIFVPTFVDYIVKGRDEEGWGAANALTSVALVGLTCIAVIVALLAPWIMRVLLVGVDPPRRAGAIAVGSDLLRLFAPQVIFYGAGMIMTGALHAHRRFGMAAVAPIFNNVIVIVVYGAYALMRGKAEPTLEGISTAQLWVLGAGTTMGVVAMTACLIPSLRRLGWRFRFDPDFRHPAVRKGARLGVWALGYAGGYQAGLIVVLILANRIEGGVAAYQWAFTFFYLPHALFGVAIFNVLFTAMSEHVSKGQEAQLVQRLRDGLGMLGFILFPVAAGLVVLAEPLVRVTLEYGVMSQRGSELVGRVLMAFALGLPGYSVFLVLTRGFYALSDTRTPALVNAATVALTMASGATLFFAAPEGWAVAGLAAGHTIGFTIGCLVLGAVLGRRVGGLMSEALARAFVRSAALAALAGGSMYAVLSLVGDGGKIVSFGAVGLGSMVGVAVYLAGSASLRAPELTSLIRVLRGLLGGSS